MVFQDMVVVRGKDVIKRSLKFDALITHHVTFPKPGTPQSTLTTTATTTTSITVTLITATTMNDNGALMATHHYHHYNKPQQWRSSWVCRSTTATHMGGTTGTLTTVQQHLPLVCSLLSFCLLTTIAGPRMHTCPCIHHTAQLSPACTCTMWPTPCSFLSLPNFYYMSSACSQAPSTTMCAWTHPKDRQKMRPCTPQWHNDERYISMNFVISIYTNNWNHHVVPWPHTCMLQPGCLPPAQ